MVSFKHFIFISAFILSIGTACRGEKPVEMVFASPEYGVHTALWWNVTYDRVPDLGYAKEMEFNWVKQNIAWRDVEDQVKGEYNVFRPDRIMDEVEAEGLNMLMRLDRPPWWALPDGQTVENGPPADYQDFGDFCGWMADRFKGRVKAYQVWNEPNLDREWGGQPPSPEDYVQLLKVCYEAIKSADPDAIVISAALSPTGVWTELVMPDDIFLRRMYEAGAADYFDVLGLNAPGHLAPPHVSAEEVAETPEYGGHRTFAFRHVEEMRDIMVEFGDAHKQVAILEMGWVTGDPGHYTEQTIDELHPNYAWYAVDPETQAENLVGAYEYARENWQPWIGLMTTIYISDITWRPETHEQWWWSIVRHDGTKQPAFEALRDMPKEQLPIEE